MNVRVWTAPQARTQARQAAKWWRKNRPAAPTLFCDELANALTLLADAPDIGKRYSHPEIPDLRRLLMPATRYHIYYVHDAERGDVAALAVWSALRGRAPRLRKP